MKKINSQVAREYFKIGLLMALIFLGGINLRWLLKPVTPLTSYANAVQFECGDSLQITISKDKQGLPPIWTQHYELTYLSPPPSADTILVIFRKMQASVK